VEVGSRQPEEWHPRLRTSVCKDAIDSMMDDLRPAEKIHAYISGDNVIVSHTARRNLNPDSFKALLILTSSDGRRSPVCQRLADDVSVLHSGTMVIMQNREKSSKRKPTPQMNRLQNEVHFVFEEDSAARDINASFPFVRLIMDFNTAREPRRIPVRCQQS